MVVQSSINQTMAEIDQVISNMITQISTVNPEISDELFLNLTICLETVLILFNKTLELSEILRELTNNSDTTASCPVEEFEELLEDLGAKVTELQSYEGVILGLPPAPRRAKRVAGMDILFHLQIFREKTVQIRIRIIIIMEIVTEKFAEIEMEENAETSKIITPETHTIIDFTTQWATTTNTMISTSHEGKYVLHLKIISLTDYHKLCFE